LLVNQANVNSMISKFIPGVPLAAIEERTDTRLS